jgi:hypothetical protein
MGHDRAAVGVLQPGSDGVLIWIGGHADQAVEAAPNALDVAGGNMVYEAPRAVAEGACLGRGEVARLGGGKLKQALQLVGSRGSLRRL